MDSGSCLQPLENDEKRVTSRTEAVFLTGTVRDERKLPQMVSWMAGGTSFLVLNHELENALERP
jgi:hypothetical protein